MKKRNQEQTIRSVFALFGLSEKQAEKAIERQVRPIPRNRKHYQYTDSNGRRHYPDLTIDEALEFCKASGIEATEKELRKGVRLSDFGFIQDSYKDGALEHETE